MTATRPFLVLLIALGLVPAAPGQNLSTLDNGTIRLGVDLDRGGSITWLSRSGGGDNIINDHDLGRQVQQSYYAGPQPFGKAHQGWENWPWNPIGSGDVYNHPACVEEHRNDGKTLFVRTIPMQWALDNVPGDCRFETTIRLDGACAEIECRLINQREDHKQYAASDQELPAVYTIGKLHRLFTYKGDRPYQNEPPSQIPNAGPPWKSWIASEHWAALVNDENWGLGVIHPGVYSFLGGFHGPPNTGGPRDDSTGYIAPVRQEILDHDIVYSYRYILVLGTLDEIRQEALKRRDADTRPDDLFNADRRHWTYQDAADSGFPPGPDGLRVHSTGPHTVLLAPERWYEAETVPKLTIQAAFRTKAATAALEFAGPGADFSAENRLVFPIQPDGQLHTYSLDLAAVPTYRHTIARLRLVPFLEPGEGDEVRLVRVSWKPD